MPFTIFPAIDLRHGAVVRLQEGDPARQKTYSTDPQEVAKTWLQAGCRWLHVVNLDGAFGQTSRENTRALASIMQAISQNNGHVQFGGGLRTIKAINSVLELGIDRVVLGTLAIEQPELIPQLISRFGSERIAVSLDGHGGVALVHGWQTTTGRSILEVARELELTGLKWLVFTDVDRDGVQHGLNLEATLALADATKLKIIASGGVSGWDDIYAAHKADLAGVIVGKALYEGVFDPGELFKLSKESYS